MRVVCWSKVSGAEVQRGCKIKVVTREAKARTEQDQLEPDPASIVVLCPISR